MTMGVDACVEAGVEDGSADIVPVGDALAGDSVEVGPAVISSVALRAGVPVGEISGIDVSVGAGVSVGMALTVGETVGLGVERAVVVALAAADGGVCVPVRVRALVAETVGDVVPVEALMGAAFALAMLVGWRVRVGDVKNAIAA